MIVGWPGRPKFEDEARDDAAEYRQREVTRGCAKIPPEFAWSRVDAPELEHRVRGGERLRALIERAQRAACVVISGPSGYGKTSLMAALFRRHVEANPFGVMWTNAFELAFAWKGHPHGQGKPPVVKAAESARVLALDDLGAEPQLPDSSIAPLIFERHGAQRRTLITTVFGMPTDADPGELSRRYGDGISRKTLERSLWIELGEEPGKQGSRV